MARRHAIGPADAASHGPSPRARPQGGLDRGRLLRPHDHRPLLRDAGPHCRRRPHHAEARPGRAPLRAPHRRYEARDPAPARRTRLRIAAVLRPVRPLRRYGPRHHAVARIARQRRNHEPRLHRRRHEGDARLLRRLRLLDRRGALRQPPSHPLACGRAARLREDSRGKGRRGQEGCRASRSRDQGQVRGPKARDHVRRDRAQQNVRRPLLEAAPHRAARGESSLLARRLRIRGHQPQACGRLARRHRRTQARRLHEGERSRDPPPRPEDARSHGLPQGARTSLGQVAARPACEHQALRRARARREGRRDARGRGHGQGFACGRGRRSRARQVPACGRSRHCGPPRQ